jgi:hypothetical protein
MLRTKANDLKQVHLLNYASLHLTLVVIEGQVALGGAEVPITTGTDYLSLERRGKTYQSNQSQREGVATLHVSNILWPANDSYLC